MSKKTYPKAIASGTLVIGSVRIPCDVLDNGQRVLSKTGLQRGLFGQRLSAKDRRAAEKAIKSTGGGDPSKIPDFLLSSVLLDYIPEEYQQAGASASGGPFQVIEYDKNGRIVEGYDCSILPLVCEVWMDAEEAGALQPNQLGRAKKARQLLRAFARLGVVGLVDEATGHRPNLPKQEYQTTLERFLLDAPSEWSPMFEEIFYRESYRLMGWEYPHRGHRYSRCAQITDELVYSRFHDGLQEQLDIRNPRGKRGKERKYKHRQFLSEFVGKEDLRNHLRLVIKLLCNAQSMEDVHKVLDIVAPKRSWYLKEKVSN